MVGVEGAVAEGREEVASASEGAVTSVGGCGDGKGDCG